MNINQSVSQVQINGQSKLDIVGHGITFTPLQGYCFICCFTLVLIILILATTKVVQTAILKVNYINPKIIEQIKEDVIIEMNATNKH